MNNPERFEDVKSRLDEIVEAVSDDNLPLDDALKLYEEAVQLGLQASSLLEENIERSNEQYDQESVEAAEVVTEDPDDAVVVTDQEIEKESNSTSSAFLNSSVESD